MNLDACSLALSQITQLVTSLTKKNFKSSTCECRSLVHRFGVEAERHLYKTLFGKVDFAHETRNQVSLQQQFLTQLCESFCSRSNFVSLLCFAVDSPSVAHSLSSGPTQQTLSILAKNLKLSLLKELSFALALTRSSQPDWRRLAEHHFKQKTNELIDKLAASNDINYKLSLLEVESAPDLIECVIAGLFLCDFKDIHKRLVDEVSAAFRKIQPPDILDPYLGPIDGPPVGVRGTGGVLRSSSSDPLHHHQQQLSRLLDFDTMLSTPTSASGGGSASGTSTGLDLTLPEVIREWGYAFTAKTETCRTQLMRLGGAERLHAATVARIVGVMARTHTGLDDSATLQSMNATGTSLWDKDKSMEPKTWNVEVFIKAVHELQPTLHWKEIVLELDHPGFVVKDRQGLILLIKALKAGFQVQGLVSPFPVEMFYRPWKNQDGQLSLIQQILCNLDVFNFAEHQHHKVATELLKVPPDVDNCELASWRSLELLDTLLTLAASGHSMAVLDMIQVPKIHCPDVLTLGLIQINPPLTTFRSEVLSQLLQIFLLNHANSAVILNYAWHSNLNLKGVVVHAMADWYSKAAAEGDTEHNRLSRILDIAQDLKALSVLLSAKAAPFVIDLAVMASRREYLNLDKWLSDQTREHGEPFVKAVAAYLQRKLTASSGNSPGASTGSGAGGSGGSSGASRDDAAATKFPAEALPAMLLCLQSSLQQQLQLSGEVKEAILAMLQVGQAMMPRQQQQQQPARTPTNMPPGVLRTSRGGLDVNPAGAFAPPLPPTAAAVGGGPGPIRPTPRQGTAGGLFPPGGAGGPPTSGPSPHDSLFSMTSQFGGLNFGGGHTPTSAPGGSGSFNLPNVLGSLVSGQSSPSRGLGTIGGAAVAGAGGAGGQQPPLPPSSMDGSVTAAAAAAAAAAGSSSSPFAAMMAGAGQMAAATSVTAGLPPPPTSSTVATAVSAATGSGSVTAGGGSTAPGGMQSGIEQIRTGNISQIFPDISGPIPREVEDEANSYFQRIYNHPPHPTMTINEILDLLKRFQDSSIQKEREVFNCMIKNLFEEYKYFPQYPEKELHTTAQLFGGIIEHGLVNMVPLGLALRFVLDAVRKSPESNMYYFGVTALDRFKARLKDYPQYCQHITCVEHFKDFPPHLIKWIECGVQSQTPPGDPPKGEVLPEHLRAIIESQSAAAAAAAAAAVASNPAGSAGAAAATATSSTVVVSMGGLVSSAGGAAPATAAQMTVAKTTTTISSTTAVRSATIVRPTATTVGGRPSIANTTNIDTLLNARQRQGVSVSHQEPSEKIQEKVAFIFNNLSLMNMGEKVNDMKEILADDYTGWLATYLVMKRASIEPNFHTLYCSFLDSLANRKLHSEVLAETYGNIRILLSSDKGIANFSDRSLLKNLGHWLGLISLGKNRPILMVELEVKPLIIEAFHKGQQELLYVVPFVAKVLESAGKSKVFKPPCPWTMGIMNLLAELHQEHDLKLNLKFEIEVLCKMLGLDIASLTPGTLLKEHDKLNKMLNFFGQKQPPVQPPPHQPPTSLPPPPVHTTAKSAMDAFSAHLPRSMPQTNSANASAAAGALGIDITSDVRSSGAGVPPMTSLAQQVQPSVAAAAAASGGGFGGMFAPPPPPTAAPPSQPPPPLVPPPPQQQPVVSQQGPGAAGAGMGMALLGSSGQQQQQAQGLLAPPSATQPMAAAAAAAALTEQQHMSMGMAQSEAMALAQLQQAANMGGGGPPPPPPPLPAATSAAAAAAASTVSARPVEPKFSFTDLNTANLNAIIPHITIDPRLTLLKDQPDLLQLVKIAIEKSIQEWLTPVSDRAIKVALTTCEQIVKKDFALDPDENRMRVAAHHIVQNLTAGMALITCREHLLLSIKQNLKNFMVTLGRNLTPAQQENIDVTVSVVANDNVELACAFIQKKAIEKALPDIDAKLKPEFEARAFARKEGRRYCDPIARSYQAERMPEQIRLKSGGVTVQQSAVYEEFARNVPGFKPLSEREAAVIIPKTPAAVVSDLTGAADASTSSATQQQQSSQQQASDECVAILEEVISKVDHFVQNCIGLPATPHMANLHVLLELLGHAKNSREPAAAAAAADRAVENLLQGLTPQTVADAESLARYRDANLLVLRAAADPRAFGASWTSVRVSRSLSSSDGAREDPAVRYNLDAFDALVRSGLVALSEYDRTLAKAVTAGDCFLAVSFAVHACKIYLLDEQKSGGGGVNVTESDLALTVDALGKLAATSPQMVPKGTAHLVEMIRMGGGERDAAVAAAAAAAAGPTAQLQSGIQQAREFEDPPGLLEKTEFLLREWVNAYHSRDAGKDSRQAFVVFVQLMNQHGILKTDDLITRFFRMSTQMCVDLCYRALGEQNNSPTLVRAKCFHTLDAYVRLITLLVKHTGETQNTVTKVNLLNKVLGIVAGVLLIDHDVRNTEFQQVPYHRIFIMLFLELSTPDQILEVINFEVLTAYCNMLHILRPAKAPGFAYAWLEIVSHRVFTGRILVPQQQQPGQQQQRGWPMYAQLLVDLFKFLSPFLRNAELARPVHRLYRGTLRVLLVLLHDFPEFLCDYHYGFCDVIPPNCIQMRNLILSAFPRNMRLPDPFTPNLKVEMLPEISIAPRTVADYGAIIKKSFRQDLDSYLKNRSPVSFLSEVRDNLLLNPPGAASAGAAAGGGAEQPGNRYNIPLINALVMYVGTSAIQYIRQKGQTPNMSTIAHSSHMDIFQNLAVDLETEGRYLFLNCIANQLRYPNSHTHYFSCTLLYLFAEANTEAIQEQVTRVLLERLIVNRPHPWGLLITFIELIKNPQFTFWQHEFVTCAPEIQKLFESVARSCMVHTMPPTSTNSSGAVGSGRAVTQDAANSGAAASVSGSGQQPT